MVRGQDGIAVYNQLKNCSKRAEAVLRRIGDRRSHRHETKIMRFIIH